MARDAVGDVRDRTEIVDLVSGYVTLKKTGRSYKGLCPFHQEKSPSFVVFPESGNFHCFGCGRGGDVFTFYMGVEHVEFREALSELARRAGVELSITPTAAPQVDAHRARLLELNEIAATFFANALANSEAGAAGRKLADDRGLSAEIISMFQLGFAPDGWDHLHRLLAARGMEPRLAVDAGLIVERESGGYFDRFRGRFIFPIKDREGKIVGFGGRALDDAQPKYLNSPQSSIFDKSALLYGLDLARDEIRRLNQVVVVEGYMDAIAAHQHGYRNVVAAMGTAVTEAQIALVKRATKRIVLALDADIAGQMATIRSLETMQESLDHESVPVPDAETVIRFERKLNAEISIVELPEGKDPDELIRRAPDLWREVIDSAKPFLDFYIEVVAGQIDPNDPRAKKEAVGRIAPLLATIGDRIIRSHYVELTARLLRIRDPREVTSAVLNLSRVRSSTPAFVVGPRLERPSGVNLEDHLLASYLRYRSVLRQAIERTPDLDLADSRNRELLTLLKDVTIPDMTVEDFIAGMDDHLADHAERLLELSEGMPSLLPAQIQRDANRTFEQLLHERFRFLLSELEAEIQAAQSEGDASALDDLKPQLSTLADRHLSFYPPKSPYFRDIRDTTKRVVSRK